MLGVTIAGILGLSIVARSLVYIDEEGKIKMPASFWAYMAWVVGHIIVSFFV